MGFKKISVVSDTGPLIHISEIDSINLLKYFNNIYVPESVRLEYIKHRKSSDPDAFELENINLNKVKDIEVKKFIDKYELLKLHLGEKECLYLCRKLYINLILTDDLAVRDTAKKLDITPVGSIGVIIKSFKENIISLSQAEKYIINLYEISSLYVTKTIVELVIEELREANKNNK